jgi:GR25 family glycosyltransferase involved in LPS biosynthesis
MNIPAFVIGLSQIPSSAESSKRVVQALEDFGIHAQHWEGTYGNDAIELFKRLGREIQPTSFKGNPIDADYIKSCSRPGVMGCFHSHYRLWQHCVDLETNILIFEDDVIFERGFEPVEWTDVLLVATGKSVHTHEFYSEKLYSPSGDPAAVGFKGKVMPGAVGYGLTPAGATKLVTQYSRYYLPADNAMNATVVELQCHNYLMGRAAIDVDGKKSLTKTSMWHKMLKRSANTAQSG